MFNSRKILSLEVGKLTDLGRVKTFNEDCLGFYQPDDPEVLYEKGELYLVANGLGGKGVGDVASRLATEAIIKEYFAPSSTTQVEESLRQAILAANAKVYHNTINRLSRENLGTAMTCAVIQRSMLYIGHVGNTRAYLIKGNAIKQITQDHILISEPSPGAVKPKGGPAVSRVLGREPEVAVDTFSLRLKFGDVILLCTDGLTREVSNKEIGRIVLTYPPQEACEQLIKLAKEREGTDNITVIIVKTKGIRSLSYGLTPYRLGTINLMPEKKVNTDQLTMPLPVFKPSTFKLESTEPEVPPEFEPVAWESSVSRPEPDSGYQDEEPAKMPPPRGIRRKRVLPPEAMVRTIKFKWPVLGIIGVVALFFGIILFTLFTRQERHLPLKRASTSDAGLQKQPQLLESELQPEPEEKMTQQEPPAIKTTEKTIQVRIITGTHKIDNQLPEIIKDLGQDIAIDTVRSIYKIMQSKILYQPPLEEGMERVRRVAEDIREKLNKRLGKNLEIVPFHISIILGTNYNPQKINIRGFPKSSVALDRMWPVNVEILNGTNRSKLAESLKEKIDGIIIEEPATVIKVVDFRNADKADYRKTVIRCEKSHNHLAQKLAVILALASERDIIDNEHLVAIKVVLGEDIK